MARPPRGPSPPATGLEVFGVVVAGLVAGAWFWRGVLASGFDLVSGNLGDNRLILALHEHWYNVLRGREAWDRPLFFFPAEGVLAFSDTTLLASLPYSALRSFGADRYVAFQCVLLAFTAAGFASFYALARASLGVAPFFALLGALTFAFSASMSFTRVAAQNLYVCLAPVLSLLLIAFLRALRRGAWRGLGFGIPFAALLAAVYFSSFNFAWFFTAFLVLAAAIDLTIDPGLRTLLGKPRCRAMLALVAAAFVLALLPFLLTYGPMALSGFERTYEVVLGLLAAPADLFNASGYLWQAIGARPVLPGDRQQYGMTPILLVTVLLAGALLWVDRQGWTATRRRALASIFLSIVACWILVVKVAETSAWAFVFRFVPGATAVRVVPRVEFVTTFFGCLLAFSCLDHAWRSGGAGARAVAVALGLLIVAEQPASHDVDGISRRAEYARLGGIPPPPPATKAFFILVPAPAPEDANSKWPTVTAQVDAMLVAEDLGVPTLNGYSGWTPPGWGLRLPTDTPEYRQQVARWLRSRAVSGDIVALDLARKRWIDPRAPRPAASGGPVGPS